MYAINHVNSTDTDLAVPEAYSVDPVHERADLSEDGGLLVVVAAPPRAKANNTMNLPGSVGALTVQWTTRVSLNSATKTNQLYRIINYQNHKL